MMRHLFLTSLLLTFLIFIGVHDAFAQASGYATVFVCFGKLATGTLYVVNSSCPTTLEFNHLFSFLVCNMEELTSNLMGHIYCGMTDALTPALAAVLTIAVSVFGTAFLIGVIPATAREFQVFLLKIVCVWVFATRSQLIIELGYRLLVNGMRQGVDLILAGFGTSGTTVTVYSEMDKFLEKVITFATQYAGISGSTASDPCKDAIFAVMAVMAVAFPPFAFLGIALLMRIAITFIRAVFGYIYAMIGIAFLLVLTPFFLSFYLFRQTNSLFQKWLGYLVSFSLQIVILFAFLAFVLSIDVSHISGSFTNIIMKHEVVKEGGSFRAPWEYCTICDFKAVDADDNEIAKDKYSEFLSSGKLKCKDNPPKAIELDTSFSPHQDKINTLMQFTAAGMMTLFVLAYILESLLAYSGSLAQALAGAMGATYSPVLGGGAANSGRNSADIPFGKTYRDFEEGFDRGFASKNNALSGLAEGTSMGLRSAIKGENYALNSKGQIKRDEKGTAVVEHTQHGGLKNRFIDWLADPNRLGND